MKQPVVSLFDDMAPLVGDVPTAPTAAAVTSKLAPTGSLSSTGSPGSLGSPGSRINVDSYSMGTIDVLVEKIISMVDADIVSHQDANDVYRNKGLRVAAEHLRMALKIMRGQ